MSKKIFEGQHNEAHHELCLEFKVTVNTVLPNNRHEKKSEEDVEKWFKHHVGALASGLQLHYGNNMHEIKVERLKDE